MKVVNEGYNYWEIVNKGKVVAEIRTFDGFKSNTKSVYVNNKKIADIKNQKEAVEKLEKFFAENKKQIAETEKLIEELTMDVELVKNEISINALQKEIKFQGSYLESLKSFDLI